ncbi:hypothetical protein [Cellulomonas denverensis]|uniref:hypothetical protein n=1 Tax=Cellulomonas denverensis TaxID=264297 RepID=UPI00144892D4|nr:hypothetical protein [Cellulomonas denverensis]
MRYITDLRLAPFLRESNGDTGRALRLYSWNIEMSGAAYEVLHRFEVLLRNAIDPCLCAWNTTEVSRTTGEPHAADWLLDPAPLLERLAHRALEQAVPRAAQAVANRPNTTPLHADVLAQTSFGTWRYLLPDRDAGRQLLWRDAVVDAFPHLPADKNGGDVTRAVDLVYQLRNRVAHLEPLLEVRKVRSQIDAAYDVAGWIDPEMRSWLTSAQRVTAMFKARLRI